MCSIRSLLLRPSPRTNKAVEGELWGSVLCHSPVNLFSGQCSIFLEEPGWNWKNCLQLFVLRQKYSLMQLEHNTSTPQSILRPGSSNSILIVFYIYLMCVANDSVQEMWCHGSQSQWFPCLLSLYLHQLCNVHSASSEFLYKAPNMSGWSWMTTKVSCTVRESEFLWFGMLWQLSVDFRILADSSIIFILCLL